MGSLVSVEPCVLAAVADAIPIRIDIPVTVRGTVVTDTITVCIDIGAIGDRRSLWRDRGCRSAVMATTMMGGNSGACAEHGNEHKSCNRSFLHFHILLE